MVEQQAAAAADRIAIQRQAESITYRQLNQQSNAVARRLIASGFRRGGYAVVCMPRGIELAIVLLAVLKAGGSYTWLEPSRNGFPRGVSIRVRQEDGEDQFLCVDVAGAVAQSAPNLPIVTRASDIACVLPDAEGAPAVMVPHATVVSLSRVAVDTAVWEGSGDALDLWAALMSGATIVLADPPACFAAA